MQIISNFLSMFWAVFKIPVMILSVILALIFILVSLRLVVYRFKFGKKKKGSRRILKKRGLLKKLLVDFPERLAKDIYNRDPDFFRYQGMHLFCGEQGSGKTMAMVEFMRRMQYEYPLSNCITNFGYKYQDDVLSHWKQLVTYKNGFEGVIVGIDELQNWFSSNDSRNFPPQMLEVVTQNRKNRRVIIGTSQVFTRLAKPIREQATLIYLPTTICGCITFVRVKKPILTSEGEVQEYKSRGWYFFVHDDDLRNAYDTYKVIESLASSGFVENKEVNTTIFNTNNVVMSKKFGK